MRNSGLDWSQAEINIARKFINDLRYTDTPSLWQKVKRNKRAS